MGDSREWIITGVCPSCSFESVSVYAGLCIHCGWLSKRTELESRVQYLYSIAMSRMEACADTESIVDYPDILDWMTIDELTRLYRMQNEIAAEQETHDEIEARIRRRTQNGINGRRDVFPDDQELPSWAGSLEYELIPSIGSTTGVVMRVPGSVYAVCGTCRLKVFEPDKHIVCPHCGLLDTRIDEEEL